MHFPREKPCPCLEIYENCKIQENLVSSYVFGISKKIVSKFSLIGGIVSGNRLHRGGHTGKPEVFLGFRPLWGAAVNCNMTAGGPVPLQIWFCLANGGGGVVGKVPAIEGSLQAHEVLFSVLISCIHYSFILVLQMDPKSFSILGRCSTQLCEVKLDVLASISNLSTKEAKAGRL